MPPSRISRRRRSRGGWWSSDVAVPRPLFDVAFPRGNTSVAVSKGGFLIPTLPQRANIPISVVFNWTGMLNK